MHLTRGTAVALVVLLFSISLARADSYQEISARRDAVKAAIVAGTVVPERDIAPLLDMLRKSYDDDDQRHLVEAIVDLGEADGSSPAAVKRYILAEATPILTAIAGNRANSNFLRSDAITGLRQLGASRSALQNVTDMALKDPDSYVQSRGEILQNYIKSMPAEGKASAIKSSDPAKERDAIAFLKSHDLGVSLDQLNRSAGESNAEEVAALVAAGVDPNGGPAGEGPLDSAISGCSRNSGENEAVLKTIDTLIAAGADVKRIGDNKNTPLLSAVQYCGAGVVQRLVQAGANVNAINGSGTTPLMMAFFMKHLDAAEALVAKGATLTADQAKVVSSDADARAKTIIVKATKKKK
jgi:uncharacterized protein